MEAPPVGSLNHFGGVFPEGMMYSPSQQQQSTVITRVRGRRRRESAGEQEGQGEHSPMGTPSAASSSSAPSDTGTAPTVQLQPPRYPSAAECDSATHGQFHLDNLATGNPNRIQSMEDDCWTELSSATANRTLIRDEFIGLAAYPSFSPPSTTIAATEFYESSASTSTNPILDDAFLSCCPCPAQPSSLLLDAPPCSSFSASSFSVDSVHHFQDSGGSVGISPCSSSSTQISSGSSDDPLFPVLPSVLRPPFHHHPSLPHHSNGIFCAIPFGHNPPSAQQHPQHGEVRGMMAAFETAKAEGDQYVQRQQQEEDEEQEEPRDVKPPLFKLGTDQQQPAGDPDQLADQQHRMLGFPMGHQFNVMDGVAGDSPPPPPSPLTPPNKMRSKMHDLALKHRLITNQNVRGQGTIQLSTEEKKTLIQEGFPIPTKLPLMREEEEALKIVRRKIKNKLSAQESRRKRKEYMDMLEKRVHAYFADNTQLRQKVRQLETQNRFLTAQLQRTQQQNGEGSPAENIQRQQDNE